MSSEQPSGFDSDYSVASGAIRSSLQETLDSFGSYPKEDMAIQDFIPFRRRHSVQALIPPGTVGSSRESWTDLSIAMRSAVRPLLRDAPESCHCYRLSTLLRERDSVSQHPA